MEDEKKNGNGVVLEMNDDNQDMVMPKLQNWRRRDKGDHVVQEKKRCSNTDDITDTKDLMKAAAACVGKQMGLKHRGAHKTSEPWWKKKRND